MRLWDQTKTRTKEVERGRFEISHGVAKEIGKLQKAVDPRKREEIRNKHQQEEEAEVPAARGQTGVVKAVAISKETVGLNSLLVDSFADYPAEAEVLAREGGLRDCNQISGEVSTVVQSGRSNSWEVINI